MLETRLEKMASRLVFFTNFWVPLQAPVISLSLGKSFGDQRPIESSIFHMDCCFG